MAPGALINASRFGERTSPIVDRGHKDIDVSVGRKERLAMPLRIELPDDLIHDLEQEAARQRIPLAEIISEALHLWRASRVASAHDRERVMQVLRARGMLCELPAELAAGAQPLAVEELELPATKAAQGGPVSELIVQERRGET
jgi:hypothetical protein